MGGKRSRGIGGLVAAALLGFAAPGAQASPTVQFMVPVPDGALWGDVRGAPNCFVTGANVRRVMFYLDGVWTNTDGTADNGFGCWIDTRKHPDGAYTLTAVAYDAQGRTASATRRVVIRNAGAPAVTSGEPAIAWHVVDTLSGNVQGPPHCVNTGYNIARVRYYLDGAWTNTDGNLVNGLGCWIDTTKHANGTYRLRAEAESPTGRRTSIEREITIRNLSAEGTRAIGTFHSIGLYWTPPADPGPAGCEVRYRAAGSIPWHEGLPLWFDPRNGECRGSLVELEPGTEYQVQLAMPGAPPLRELRARTWSETYPIARVVHVASRSQQLNITEGGSASGYVLYTSPPGALTVIDGGNAATHNIAISAPFVIVRGLVLRGARADAIRLLPGAGDIVIEDNDISGWGRDSGKLSSEGWRIGVNEDSAVRAMCSGGPWLERTVIQRNRIHHPRYGANSWSDGHPLGPHAVFFRNCGGNHVFRYNEVYSDSGRYFNDGFGGGDNFSGLGSPNADSDIYGNRFSHIWDDAIEAEGANRNVRIWGNYMDQTAVGVASSATHVGPVYIFRNVLNRTRQLSQTAPDEDHPLGRAFAKSGSTASFGGGRRYVFHNTLLQAPPLPGSTLPQGAGIGLKGNAGQPLTNTVSRNNIYEIRQPWLAAIDDRGGTDNDLDFDLFNGGVNAYRGAEANGILGTPIYAPGHGWANEAGGLYQLAPESPGFDAGARLPNFNDGYTGAAPDMGAHEAGTPPMRFGLRAGWPVAP